MIRKEGETMDNQLNRQEHDNLWVYQIFGDYRKVSGKG